MRLQNHRIGQLRLNTSLPEICGNLCGPSQDPTGTSQNTLRTTPTPSSSFPRSYEAIFPPPPFTCQNPLALAADPQRFPRTAIQAKQPFNPRFPKAGPAECAQRSAPTTCAVQDYYLYRGPCPKLHLSRVPGSLSALWVLMGPLGFPVGPRSKVPYVHDVKVLCVPPVADSKIHSSKVAGSLRA